MKNHIILLRFHIYNKIHLIHRNNLQKSWNRVQRERRKLRINMDRVDYIKLLEKYNINNHS
jgi:hypothetical protein